MLARGNSFIPHFNYIIHRRAGGGYCFSEPFSHLALQIKEQFRNLETDPISSRIYAIYGPAYRGINLTGKRSKGSSVSAICVVYISFIDGIHLRNSWKLSHHHRVSIVFISRTSSFAQSLLVICHRPLHSSYRRNGNNCAKCHRCPQLLECLFVSFEDGRSGDEEERRKEGDGGGVHHLH